MECQVCNKKIESEKFRFILIHIATKEDYKDGSFAELEKELVCCNDCILNLNFREYD